MHSSYTYTFIIPHKNTPDLLRRCVDSIPARDDIQIIIIDDNSDEDKKPCLNRGDVEVVHLDKDHSKGAGRARNVGLGKAKGKWLLFADADDYYNDILLDTLDRYSGSEYDVVYFSFLNVLPDNSYSEPEYHKWIRFSNEKENQDKVKYKHNAPWNKMVRKELIVDRGIQFEETINGNDLFYSFQVGWFSNCSLFIDAQLYNYVFSNNSITRSREINKDRILCQLRHLYQTNSFKKYLGYSDWQIPVIRFWLTQCRSKGFFFLLRAFAVFVCNFPSIWKSRDYYVCYFGRFNDGE